MLKGDFFSVALLQSELRSSYIQVQVPVLEEDEAHFGFVCPRCGIFIAAICHRSDLSEAWWMS